MKQAQEITSYAQPGSGIDIQKVKVTAKMNESYEKHEAANRILISNAAWTSHTVIVVDQSGSMRKADVEGGASRSDAVWTTLALEFIAKQIQGVSAVQSSDVVTIITMKIEAIIVVDREPLDWILFNKIVDLMLGRVLYSSNRPCRKMFTL
jgi:hypothetical protein